MRWEGATERARAGVGRPRLGLTHLVGGWALGLAVTAATVGTPYLLFGYHSPSLHLVLDSVDGCVALLVAYLLYGRLVRTRRLQDLLLAQGMLLLAVAGLGLTLLLGRLEGLVPGTVDAWLPLAARVVGALLIGAAAFAGQRPAPPNGLTWARVAPWAVLLALFLTLWLARDGLPVAVAASPPTSAQRPLIEGHPLLLVAQGLTALSFAAASVAFAVQSRRRDDELVRWLVPAFALAAFARVNYLLFPSLYTDWVYTGDLLRTGCYLLLLVGAAREIGQYWATHARAAVLEDRRRLARELHDGLVQELAYIRSEALTLAQPSPSPSAGAGDRIVASTDRALDEARAAVDALGRSPEEPLGYVLHRAARQVADRHHGHLDVEVDDGVTADVEQRHALVRITREAVSNALRHGQANRVCLRVLRDQRGCCLLVQDDGQGFDPAEVQDRSTGYGLVSMRERAVALPGSFTIESAPGRGTVVGVAW